MGNDAYPELITKQAKLVLNDGKWLQFGRNDNTGNAQVLLTFELADGSRMQGFFGLTPKSMKYTMDKLHTCGFEGTSLRDMEHQTPHGKVELACGEEEYQGKRTMKIKFINRQGGFSIKAEDRLSIEDLDELSDLVKSDADDDIAF